MVDYYTKKSVTFLQGKFPDARGNNTYLFLAGKPDKYYNYKKWRRTKEDKEIYEKIMGYCEKLGLDIHSKYRKNLKYGRYTDITTKGYILIIADSWDFLVHEFTRNDLLKLRLGAENETDG